MFHDFVAKCLTKEPRLRPTASEMLKVCPAYLSMLYLTMGIIWNLCFIKFLCFDTDLIFLTKSIKLRHAVNPVS